MAAYTTHLNTSITLDAPIERLWPLLSDTDRVNRMIGLPAFERAEPNEDLTQIIHGHFLGVPVSWREYPFEWVFEQEFSVERAFAPPVPVERLVTRTRLTPLEDGRTRAEVYVGLAPRLGPVGALGGRLVVGQKMLRDLRGAYRTLGALAAAAGAVAPPPLRPAQVNQGRLAAGAERLRQFGISPRLAERLAAHLRTADDPEVVKMRPFALADRWGERRLDVLRLFLYATRAGLLDLEWDVLCPNCRGPSVRARTLADLAQNAHCTSCNIRYDVNFDESVELRFSVSPMVRDAVDLSYCIGGPASTRHILAQLWLPAGGTKELRLRLPAGSYRVRSRQFTATAAFEADPLLAERRAAIRLGEGDITIDAPALAAGEAALTLRNETGSSLLVVIEQTAWSAQAASAALVSTLDEFRQLFSAEVLAPGLGISIRTLTFLFSDLKDSTRIYDSLGDSPAYARVRDHFDVMRELIARHNGALVKTIGDAVMAVFTSADDGLRAALEIQEVFTAGEIARGNPALQVKLGLHRGPCIAVNANGLLDYFGSTVNIAARVQGESVGGDIVVTEELLADPEVQALLAQVAPAHERFNRDLKGISRSPTLYRLWPAAEALKV
jgi:adenylate cyclase